jgi:hypothetical protein
MDQLFDVNLPRKSRKSRRTFTDQCKNSGFQKQEHYIAISKLIKEQLGLKGKKKNEYTADELAMTTAVESLLTSQILHRHPKDYHDLKPIAIDTCNKVMEFVYFENNLNPEDPTLF